MADPDDNLLRDKNRALGAVLLGLVVLLFCLTLVKFGGHYPASGQ